MKIELADGKYTYLFDEKTGKAEALRHGQQWRDCIGDGFILAMAQEIESLRDQLTTAGKDTARLEWLVIGGGKKIHAHIAGSDEKGWAVMDCSNGLTFVARGQKTFREAIDAAITNGEKI